MKRKQVTFRCCITFTYSQIVCCPDWTCVWMFWSPSRFVERKWIFKTCHLAFKYYVRYIMHILICLTLSNLPLWQLLWTRFYSHPFFTIWFRSWQLIFMTKQPYQHLCCYYKLMTISGSWWETFAAQTSQKFLPFE